MKGLQNVRKHIGSIAIFSLYTFFYLALELAINDYAVPVIGSTHITVLYGFGYIVLALGYLLYAPAMRLIQKSLALRIVVVLVGVVDAAAFLTLSFTDSISLFTFCVLLSHFTSGFLGGTVYYHAALSLWSSSRVGLVIGCAYAAANIVQVLGLVILSFLSIPAGRWVERAALICALAVIVCYVVATIVPKTKPVRVSAATPKPIKKFILGGLVAMALIALLQGVNDGVATFLHASDEQYLVYGFPRLFMIPGLLAAGALADLRDHRFFPFATVLAMIIMSAALLLFSSPGTYSVATSIIYFFGSFMSLFSIVPFMQWAFSTSNPALVSVAGRSVRYAFSGIAIMVGGAVFPATSNTVLLFVYIVLLALLLTVFFFMGQLRLPSRNGLAAPNAFQVFAFQYSLTDREVEILTLLCDGLTTREIGKRLFIADKTVRNHISNMLAKTNKDSRSELLSSAKQIREEYEFEHLHRGGLARKV